MLKSRIQVKNGKPLLYIEDAPVAAMAYTTYFEERSCFEDFVDAGYQIFFVNASFTTSPINSGSTGFTPFDVGVYEGETPDYSEFEDEVCRILKKCPDAVIFPRIYVSMPKWWTEKYPEETVLTPKGGFREMLFSERFRQDGGELLRRFVAHVKESPYADRVGGWQLCGGQTQEWFHPDGKGCLCPNAEKYFRKWVEKHYGDDGAILPDVTDFESKDGSLVQTNENAKRYIRFSEEETAKTIDHFLKTVKEETGYSQIVGLFYGYSYENGRTVLFGSHALVPLLNSPNADFFSSPNAYTQNRAFGIDWADMIPVDSVKHHGKLAFIECDIRTYLTTGISEARPGRYPLDMYPTGSSSVWSGPPTAEGSREALRKCFAHQITKASAVWWFDMWGGWYHDPMLMDELTKMKKIYDADRKGTEAPLEAEVVFFADEKAYENLLNNTPPMASKPESGVGIVAWRTAMGLAGAPFDSVAVEDAPELLKKYKAAIFPFPVPSQAGQRAMDLCREYGIPYLAATMESPVITVEMIRSFYEKSGIHLYADVPDVVYVGNGYLGLHSKTAGKKTVRLPRALTLAPVFGAEEGICASREITFYLEENATALFSVAEPGE